MSLFILYLLPILYTFILAFLLYRNQYFRTNGWQGKWVVAFFLAKCASAIVNSYVSVKYIPHGGDIPLFFGDGLQLYQTLFHNPANFFIQLEQLFTFNDVDVMNPHSGIVNAVFGGIKFIHFLLDLFSFGNLYTNVILFNGLATWLFIRCWIFFKKILGTNAAGAWIFLMPSAFYNCSGILKEGILMVLIAAIFPLVYKFYSRFSARVLLQCLVLFLLMVFFKFLIAFTFLAGLTVWWLMLRFPEKRMLIVVLTVFVSVACFFSLGYISPKLNMQQYLVNRQQEFLTLDAHSKIDVPQLQPTFSSFLLSLPTALNDVFFKPLPGEGGKIFYFPFTIEIFSFWILLILAWAKNKWNAGFKGIPSLVWAMMVFAMVNLLIIGYTIPNIGAITRYRSIFLPFIGLFFWMAFNGNSLLSLVIGKKWKKYYSTNAA